MSGNTHVRCEWGEKQEITSNVYLSTSNNAQYVLIKKLAEKYQNIAVVGDDYQSIYAFRGADIRNILNFNKDYPSAKIIKLVENYRSQGHIIDAANSIIKNNKNQMHKTLKANIDKKNKIAVIKCQTPKDTAVEIGTSILEKVKSKEYNFSDFAILYRNNSMSADIELQFQQMKIPFIKYSGLDFFEREEIQDILKYLELIHNTNNIESFSRIISKPKRRIADKTIKKIVREHFDQDLLTILDDLSQIERVQKIAVAEGKKFADMIRKHQEMAKTQSVANVISSVLKDIEYEGKVLANYDEEAQEEKSSNILKMLELIRTDENEKGRRILLDEYIENITMYNQRDEDSKDSVKLMTLHCSKGLEFPVVHIIGMNEQQFPSVRFSSFGEFPDPKLVQEALEEERRLCYVGVTRAKFELSLHTSNFFFKKDGGKSYLTASKFISEIDLKNLELI